MMQVSDLYAVRPICALCCCAFSSTLSCYRLNCCHLFCQECLKNLTQGDAFMCPFDNSLGPASQFNPQYVATMEGILAAPAWYSGAEYQEYLINIFTTMQSSINFSAVPCRAFLKAGQCPNVQRYCFYDHTTGQMASSQCPFGQNCYRIAFCPYVHTAPPASPGTPTTFPTPPLPVLGPQPTPPVQPPSPFQYHRLPRWFDSQPMGQTSLVTLAPTDKSYKEVEKNFNYTSSSKATIVKIERIQNKDLYLLFAHKHEDLSQIEGRSLTLMQLWHGTRKFHPDTVYDSAVGLDPRIGHGAWGQGTYYARSSSYSVNKYGHKLSDGTKQIMCMLVIVGDTVDFPASDAAKVLIRPPFKQGTNKLFHSVKGQEGGSDIYVTYEPNMSYPAYLVTFR